MAKVFISYSWEDRAIAKKIAEHLKQDGAETWIDFTSIKGGQRFTERVNQALEWCDVLLLIWTKSSAASYYVGLEWQCALDLQKIIIPCLIDDTKRPAILRGFHYIDFKNFDEGYEQLFQALELIRKQPPEPSSISEQKVLDQKPQEKQKQIKREIPKKPDRCESVPEKEQQKEAPAMPTPADELHEKQKLKKIAYIVVAILIIAYIGNYVLSRMISKDDQNGGQVIKESTEDSLRTYWEKQQLEMNDSYLQAQQSDSDANLTASVKAQTWQDFLTRYAMNNPDSRRDDSLRTKANDRKIYWCNQATQDSLSAADKAKWENWQAEMNNSYQQALRWDSSTSLTAADKAQMWQDFLNDYAKNNPNSNADDELRTKAINSRNDWRNYQPPLITPPTEITVKGMILVLIPGGTFEMGDTFGDGGADEKPVHFVTVSDFYMGQTEVTVAQYRAFCQATGRQMSDAPSWSWQDNHPIVNVSWNDAVAFCQWADCRLPTEAEWEYAAREGGKKVKWSGTSNESSLGEYAWYSSNSGSQTHPVKMKKPNILALYDMSGNVWEWCADWYDENYYQNSPQNNPKGPASSPIRSRVWRGGGWNYDARDCFASRRGGDDLDSRVNVCGFRVVQDSLQ